jgi:hypothetical protein
VKPKRLHDEKVLRAFVFGAAGYIDKVLARRLAARDREQALMSSILQGLQNRVKALEERAK